MEFQELSINGVFLINLNPILDSRGFFMRTYDQSLFKSRNLNTKWVHENHSTSGNRGTLRGFHFQFPPHSETKLVRVVSGSVLDVFLDIRRKSPTFGKWDTAILSSDNKKCLYLPKGIAHGMCTLEDNTTMVYKVDQEYQPDSEGQIKWDDSKLNIEWPQFDEYTISEKDQNAMSFSDFLEKFGGLNI